MKPHQYNVAFAGLTDREVEESRSAHGRNKVETTTKNYFWSALKSMLKEPMLLLLATASILYFIHGDIAEAVFLLAAIVLVASISRYQEKRSKIALEALRKLTQPKSKVIRNNTITEIDSEDIVIGDLLVVDEGFLIPADGIIIQSNDFMVNEAILTGESLPVEKDVTPGKNEVFQGTQVLAGLAICQTTAIGIKTRLGQIEKSLSAVKEEKSPLQIQIENFVKKMAAVGIVFFVTIWAFNFYNTGSIVDSLLNALTLAMSILPEEIPVAFATFMALGAWRLAQLGIIVKNTKTVETLGSATVICVDKTGTITKNEMMLIGIYVAEANTVLEPQDTDDIRDVIRMAMWASEPLPFDPMEKAIHDCYKQVCEYDERPDYKLVHEYPLSGKPPFMTHVFTNEKGEKIIAAKGAPEAILHHSQLSDVQREQSLQALESLTQAGYRVLGVGQALNVNELPASQTEYKFNFKGFVAFYDPPKENIPSVLEAFYKAGLKVKIITGDNEKTTSTIASQIQLRGADKTITGDQLMIQTDAGLLTTVNNTTIFARMFPDAKLRVIEALKKQGEIVAMIGDGVNDAPALKAANIGIAMGHKGSEIAKQSSALVLADDDLAKMVDAIEAGRKIYANLKKAIQYIISIHIPIILIVFLPLVLGWIYPVIFSPVHVIFLELIMGPTCSVIYENEPMEANAMNEKPRTFTTTFFNLRELSTSLLQGLAITAGLIAIYGYTVNQGGSNLLITSTVFIALITANITLTLVNRSFVYSVFTTMRYRNKLVPLIIGITVALVFAIFTIPTLREFFRLETPGFPHVVVSVLAGFCSVIWIEVFKYFKRKSLTGRHPA